MDVAQMVEVEGVALEDLYGLPGWDKISGSLILVYNKYILIS
jgi:hypothetical protein